MRARSAALALVALTGCASDRPGLAPGKGGLIVVARAAQDEDVARSPIDPYNHRYSYGAESRKYDYAAFDDLVVHVASRDARPRGGDPREIALAPEGFEPSFLALGAGDRVRVVNRMSRPVGFYAVDAEMEEEAWSSKVVDPGSSADWSPPAPRLMRLYAQGLDSEATIFSAPGQDVAVVESGGEMVLWDLSPGEYAVGGWHPILPCESETVTVRAGEYAEVELVFSVETLGPAQQ